jgi:hypothetical protein
MPQEILEYTGADFGVVRYGEEALPKLFQAPPILPAGLVSRPKLSGRLSIISSAAGLTDP